MIQTIRKAWAIPELRKKLVFTALLLLIFRIGNAITVNPLTATQISDDQVTKGAGWMPWHWTPKKDVVSCEKPRGAASRH